MDINSISGELSPGEVRDVIASAILKMDADKYPISPQELVIADAVATRLGMSSNNIQHFERLNRPHFQTVGNDFVNKLISAGILQWDWVDRGRTFKLNSDRASTLETLTTLEGITNLEAVESLEDDELRSRCEQLVIAGVTPDQLVREASTVLEARLRSCLPDGEPRHSRRNLPGKVLNPDSRVVVVSTDRALSEDFSYLVRGLLGFYGSEVHHLIMDVGERSARRFLNMVDEVLVTIANATPEITDSHCIL